MSNLIPVVTACSLSFMVGLVGVQLCDLSCYLYWHSLCFLDLTVSFSVPFQHQITCLWETIAILVHNNYVLTSFKISLFLNKPEFKPRLFFFSGTLSIQFLARIWQKVILTLFLVYHNERLLGSMWRRCAMNRINEQLPNTPISFCWLTSVWYSGGKCIAMVYIVNIALITWDLHWT